MSKLADLPKAIHAAPHAATRRLLRTAVDCCHVATKKTGKGRKRYHLTGGEVTLAVNSTDSKVKVIPAMVYYLQNVSKHEVGVRLKLAHILIAVEKRPRQALYVLDKRQQPLQNETQTEILAQLREKAEQAKATITTEPPPDEW